MFVFLKKYWVVILIVLLCLAAAITTTVVLLTRSSFDKEKYINKILSTNGFAEKTEDAVRVTEDKRVDKINALNTRMKTARDNNNDKIPPDTMLSFAKECYKLCQDDANCKSWEVCPQPSGDGFGTGEVDCLGCYNFTEAGIPVDISGDNRFAGNK